MCVQCMVVLPLHRYVTERGRYGMVLNQIVARVYGYFMVDRSTHTKFAMEDVVMPPATLETQGMWCDVPASVPSSMGGQGGV